MSAYLTSNDTISALVTYWEHSTRVHNHISLREQLTRAYAAASDRRGTGWDFSWATTQVTLLLEGFPSECHAAFALLLRENINSLVALYPNDEDMWSDAGSYRFRRSAAVQRWVDRRPFGHGNLVGMVRGYSYQSCEHKGWSGSEAFQIIEQIRTGLLIDLEQRDCPDSSPWASFTEPPLDSTFWTPQFVVNR